MQLLTVVSANIANANFSGAQAVNFEVQPQQLGERIDEVEHKVF